VATKKQLIDIFTKALDANRFDIGGELSIFTFEELYQLQERRRATYTFYSLHLVVHEISGISLQTSLNYVPTHHQLLFTHIISLALYKLRKPLSIVLALSHISNSPYSINHIMKFVDNQDSKMSKASESIASKSSKDQTGPTLSKTRVTRGNAKEGSSDYITDATPIPIVPGRVPTKRRTKTLVVKKAKPLNVSEPFNPSMLVQLPPSDVRNVESPVIVKKPHSMTSLYVDPLKFPNVDHDVVTSAKDSVISNVVGNAGTYEKSVLVAVSIGNPRFEKIL